MIAFLSDAGGLVRVWLVKLSSTHAVVQARRSLMLGELFVLVLAGEDGVEMSARVEVIGGALGRAMVRILRWDADEDVALRAVASERRVH